jgi:hypothetical protein
MVDQVETIWLCELSPAAKISGVPVLVCPIDGEKLYRADVAQRLDEIRDHFGTPDRIEVLHVFEYVVQPQMLETTSPIRDVTAVATLVVRDLVGT